MSEGKMMWQLQRGAAYCSVLATVYWILLVIVQHFPREGKQINGHHGHTNGNPTRQPKPVAVTPVQKRKSKTESVGLVSDEGEA